MPRRARRSTHIALRAAPVALLIGACGPSRFRIADPPARPGLGSEDRRCVLPPPGVERQPGHLDPYVCAAWTDRNQSAVHPHQWVFFPHFAIGATDRVSRECPACVLDVQKGDRPTYSALVLRAPPDGEVIARYDGQLVAGRFHGQGRLQTTRTTACVNECTDLFVAHGRVARSIMLSGSWRDGFLVFDAAVTGGYAFDDGESYEGRIAFDPTRGPVPSGPGRWTGADASTYIGEFVDGLRDGTGTLTSPDGATYTGAWSLGRRHGQGVATWPDGARYEGAWERDRRHGRGTLQAADGSTHDGEFVGDVVQGPGRHRAANGLTVEGDWAQGRLADGPATIVWVDGTRYVGSVVDAAPDGAGAATFPDGSTYRGAWRAGLPHGRGLYTRGEAVWVLGEFEAGRPIGCALIRTPAGSWVGQVTTGLDLTTDCGAPPRVWSVAEAAAIDDPAVTPRTLLDALTAQRRSRATRTAAEALRGTVAAALIDPVPESFPANAARVDVALKWPLDHQQRFVHPSCAIAGELTVEVDDRPAPIRRGGVVDAHIVLAVGADRTTKVCVAFAGACGAWRGCATADIGPSGAGATAVTVGLDRAP